MAINVVDAARAVDSGEPSDGEAFRADLQKFYRIDLNTTAPTARELARLWLKHFGLHCVAAYRFDRFARRLARRRRFVGAPVLLAARAACYAVRLLHHVEVEAEVGPGFYIGHAGNIFIGPTRIGRNCSVTHNVTIGVGHQFGARGVPVLGDDVWIGTGAVLAGQIRVGNSVTVGNGAMVSRDVPDGALVVGNPARVVKSGYDNSALLAQTEASPGA